MPTLPMSCSRKPYSICGSLAEHEAADGGDLGAVGGDPLGVVGGVGVARLDRVRERAHGRRVGLAQLARALALAPRRGAQVGGVALELALLGGVLGARALERRAQRLDLGAGVLGGIACASHGAQA